MATSNSLGTRANTTRSVLLVGGDTFVREMLSLTLSGEGYSVLPAANGGEARTIAAANPVDLVVLDLDLSDGDGWDACGRIMAQRPQCKVIVVTDRPHQQMRAIETGVDALLGKPVNRVTFVNCIRSLLRETRSQRSSRLINAYVNRRQVDVAFGIHL